MSKKLPPELMGKRNDHALVMDRSNVCHRQRPTAAHMGACGRQGTPVTLAQGIAWSGRWCAHTACYEPPYTMRGSR